MLKSFSGAKLVHVTDKSKFSFAFVEDSSIISIACCVFHIPYLSDMELLSNHLNC